MAPSELGAAVSPVEGMRTLSLRHLANAGSILECELQRLGIDRLPNAGECLGRDPWLVWRRPSECLLLTSHDEVVERLLASLRLGAQALVCAVELTEALAILCIDGENAIKALASSADSHSIPAKSGHASTGRWDELSVTLARINAVTALMLVDRAVQHQALSLLQAQADAADW